MPRWFRAASIQEIFDRATNYTLRPDDAAVLGQIERVTLNAVARRDLFQLNRRLAFVIRGIAQDATAQS